MHKVTRFKRQTLKWRLWLRPLFNPFVIYIQSQVRRMGGIGTGIYDYCTGWGAVAIPRTERLVPELGTAILAPREEEVEGQRSILGLKERETLSSSLRWRGWGGVGCNNNREGDPGSV